MIVTVYDDTLARNLSGTFNSVEEALQFYAQELDTTEDMVKIVDIQVSKNEKEAVFNYLKKYYPNKKIYSLEQEIETPVDEIIQLSIKGFGNITEALQQIHRHNPDIVVVEDAITSKYSLNQLLELAKNIYSRGQQPDVEQILAILSASNAYVYPLSDKEIKSLLPIIDNLWLKLDSDQSLQHYVDCVFTWMKTEGLTVEDLKNFNTSTIMERAMDYENVC